jgi:hypothetical protein
MHEQHGLKILINLSPNNSWTVTYDALDATTKFYPVKKVESIQSVGSTCPFMLSETYGADNDYFSGLMFTKVGLNDPTITVQPYIGYYSPDQVQVTLALHTTTLTIAKKVMFQVKQIEQVESKKLDSELTKAVCKLVHVLVKESVKGDKPDLSKKQAEQIDTKAVVLLALQEVFSLTPEEVQLLIHK